MESVVVENEDIKGVFEACAPSLQRAYTRVIDALKSGELSRGMSLKSIGSAFYLRVTKEARLVVFRERIDEKEAWVLLEFIPFHDLDGATYFNKTSAVNRFRTRHREKIAALVASAELGQIVNLESESMAGAGAEPEPEMVSITPEICFYRDQIIEPTRTQADHINHICDLLIDDTGFSGLTAGPPGSGKTFMANEVANRLMANSAFTGRIIYVAQSSYLRKEFEKQWQASSSYSEEKSKSVGSCSYESLLAECGISIEGSSVSDDDLEKFFHVELKKLKQLHGDENPLKLVAFDQFRQECDVIATLDNFEQYKKIGSNHSLFHGNEALQKQLWDLYQTYDSGLKEKGLYHPQLVKLDVECKLPSDTVLIVDEALDLSRCQLQNLSRLGAKVLYLGDYNQDLSHISHTLEYLRHLVAGFVGQTYIGKLERTFRCGSNVVAVANSVLSLKQKLVPHGSDLVETSVESGLKELGSIPLMKATPANLATIRANCQRTDTAVICINGQQEEVGKYLNAPLTFSVEQIKGLGYRRIILWNLVSPQQAKQYLDLSSTGKLKRNVVTAEQKTMLVELNHLFTAITRAEIEVVVTGNHMKHPDVIAFFEMLRADIRSDNESEAKSKPLATPSTQQEWMLEAQKQIAQGNRLHAERIAKAYGFTLPPEDAAEEESKPAETTASSGVLESKTDPKEVKADKVEDSSNLTRQEGKPAVADESNQTLVLDFVYTSTTKRHGRKKREKLRKENVSIDFAKPLGGSDLDVLLALDISQIKTIQYKHLLGFLKSQADNRLLAKRLRMLLEKLATHLDLHAELRRWLQTYRPIKGSVYSLLAKDRNARKIFYKLIFLDKITRTKPGGASELLTFLSGVQKKSAATALVAASLSLEGDEMARIVFTGLLPLIEGQRVLGFVYGVYPALKNSVFMQAFFMELLTLVLQPSESVHENFQEEEVIFVFKLLESDSGFYPNLNTYLRSEIILQDISWVWMADNYPQLLNIFIGYAKQNNSIRPHLCVGLSDLMEDNWTALHVVAKAEDPSNFKAILEYALEDPDVMKSLKYVVNVQLERGSSVWHLAAQSSPGGFVALIKMAAVDRDLLMMLCDIVNVQTSGGWNVWHLAAQHSPVGFKVMLMLALKAPDLLEKLAIGVNLKSNDGWGVWSAAAYTDCFKALIDCIDKDRTNSLRSALIAELSINEETFYIDAEAPDDIDDETLYIDEDGGESIMYYLARRAPSQLKYFSDFAAKYDDVCIAILDSLLTHCPEPSNSVIRLFKKDSPALYKKLKVLANRNDKYLGLSKYFESETALLFYDDGVRPRCASGDPMLSMW